MSWVSLFWGVWVVGVVVVVLGGVFFSWSRSCDGGMLLFLGIMVCVCVCVCVCNAKALRFKKEGVGNSRSTFAGWMLLHMLFNLRG